MVEDWDSKRNLICIEITLIFLSYNKLNNFYGCFDWLLSGICWKTDAYLISFV